MIRSINLKECILPVFVVGLNLLVKGFYLSSNSIGGDEPFSIFHAQMDVFTIVELLSKGNNPPLYELFLHFWINLFGISKFSVRLPSLIFSCVSVWFLYRLAFSFFNKKVAIIVGLLFVFSNYETLFAHEARVYSLLCMLSIISMFYYLKIISEINPKKKHLILLLIVSVMLTYAHFFGFILIFIQVLFVLLSKDLRGRYWKLLILFLGVITCFYLPYLPIIVHRFLDSSVNGTWVSSPEGVKTLYNMIRAWSNAPVVATLVILILFSALVKCFVKGDVYVVKIPVKLVLVWFFVPFFLMFFISYYVPMFLDRYLIFLSGGFYLLVALCSDYLIRVKIYNYIIPVVLICLFVVTTKPNISNKRNVEEVVQKVKSLKRGNTLVLCTYHFGLNFTYYYDVELFKSVNDNMMSNMFKSLEKQNVFGITDVSEVPLNNWEKDHVIYVDAATDFLNPNNGILERLNSDYELISHVKIYEIFDVYEYGRRTKSE